MPLAFGGGGCVGIRSHMLRSFLAIFAAAAAAALLYDTIGGCGLQYGKMHKIRRKIQILPHLWGVLKT